jgi:hypothetical protein
MKENIEINVQNLIDNLVTCEEFCILQLLFKQQETLLDKYVDNPHVFIYRLFKGLIDKGYIITPYELIDFNNKESIKLDKSKCLSLFGVAKENTAFYTLFSTYPQKVPARSGGTRSLRPANVDGKQAKALMKKYFAKVGKKEDKQKHVQAVLEAELALRRKTNALQYLPGLEVYLNGYKWESYEYLLTEEKQTDDRKPKRGEQLI